MIFMSVAQVSFDHDLIFTVHCTVLIFCVLVYFLSSLQLLLQKARHRDSDPAAAAAAVLANFLKTLYFRRWKSWMLHTLYMDASCYEVSISRVSNVLDLIYMVQ